MLQKSHIITQFLTEDINTHIIDTYCQLEAVAKTVFHQKVKKQLTAEAEDYTIEAYVVKDV